jgi:hypothetical protein
MRNEWILMRGAAKLQEHIEFKDRNAPDPDAGGGQNGNAGGAAKNGGGGCCVIV